MTVFSGRDPGTRTADDQGGGRKGDGTVTARVVLNGNRWWGPQCGANLASLARGTSRWTLGVPIFMGAGLIGQQDKPMQIEPSVNVLGEPLQSCSTNPDDGVLSDGAL